MAIVLVTVGRIHGRESALIAGYDEQGRELRIVSPPVTCPGCHTKRAFFRRDAATLDMRCVACCAEGARGS